MSLEQHSWRPACLCLGSHQAQHILGHLETQVGHRRIGIVLKVHPMGPPSCHPHPALAQENGANQHGASQCFSPSLSGFPSSYLKPQGWCPLELPSPTVSSALLVTPIICPCADAQGPYTAGSLVWGCSSASQLPQPQLHGMAEHSQGCRCIVPCKRGMGHAGCLARPAPQLPQTCAYGEVLILLSTQGEDQHVHERMLAQESLGFSWGAGLRLEASRAGGSSWDRRSARVPWGSPMGGCIPRVLGVAGCPPPASPFPLVQPAPQCLALISASPQRGH